MTNKKKPDDSWFGFFRNNPIYGAIIVILVFVALSAAPFEPGICTADEQNPRKYVVRYHLIHWLFAFVDKYSSGIGAITAFVIAAFTYTLKNASIEQGRFTERSVRAAERALTEIERPWLFVHITPGTKRGTDLFDREFATIIFTIANYGKAPATIVECNFASEVAYKPIAHLQSDYHDTIAPNGTKAGKSSFSSFIPHMMVLDFSDGADAGEALVPDPHPGQNVFFMIQISYEGIAANTLHETCCLWRCDFDAQYWVRTGGKQLNRRT